MEQYRPTMKRTLVTFAIDEKGNPLLVFPNYVSSSDERRVRKFLYDFLQEDYGSD